MLTTTILTATTDHFCLQTYRESMLVSPPVGAEAVLAPGPGGPGCWGSEGLEGGQCGWGTVIEGESRRMRLQQWGEQDPSGLLPFRARKALEF